MYHFDGHALGVLLAQFLSPPAYGGCRTTKPGMIELRGNDCFERPGSAFPTGTSVAVVGDKTVAAVVWFGGTYFSTHSDFPVAVGADEATVAARLGPVETTFDVVAGYIHFHARRHRDRVFSLADRGVVVGYAVGELPDDPKASVWQEMLDLYMNTPMPAPLAQVANDHDACQLAFVRIFDALHVVGKFADDIDDCDSNRTRPYLACLARATTEEAVRACKAGPSW